MTTPVEDDPNLWPVEHANPTPCGLVEYATFIYNANLWLTQAAQGQVPHDGCIINPLGEPRRETYL